MEYLIGVALAVAAGMVGWLAGLDRDRAFYPIVLIVIASYYDLFAVIGGGEALAAELVASLIFGALAIVAFRYSLWIAVAALMGHGIFDFVHPHLIENPGVPTWWPMFCAAYDVTAGAFLALQLRRRAT